MRKRIALLLALVLALGVAALAAGKDPKAGEETKITVTEGLEIVVPAVPEIDVPDVPKSEPTKAPKLKVPEIPEIDLPSVDTGLGTIAPAEAPTAAPLVFVDDEVEAALDALGDETYRKTYHALLAGEAVARGSKGETARGVQMTLIALGQKIAADGDVGPKTLAALNAVQKGLGLEQTQTLDAAGYGALLIGLAGE